MSGKSTKARLIAYVLLFAVMFSAAAGCSAGGNSGKTGPANSSTDNSKDVKKQPISTYPIEGNVELSYWLGINAQLSQVISNFSEAPYWQELSKRTGVKLKFIHPVLGQEQEQFNLLIASKQLPDIISGGYLYKGGKMDSGTEFQAMYDGVFIDLSKYAEIYAPDYWKLLISDAETYREVTDEKGGIPGFYRIKPYTDPPFQRIILREDALKKYNEKAPWTIADYERIFDKMLADGIKPYALVNTGLEDLFLGSYDIKANFYKDAGGKLHFGQIEEGFRKYLTQMNRWYTKGYILQDFPSLKDPQVQNLFDTNQIGMMTGAIVANYNRTVRLGFTVTAAPYPRLNNATDKYNNANTDWPRPLITLNDIASVTSSCKNPEAAVRLLNYAYTKDGSELANWGIKGLNYDVVNGKNVYTDKMLNDPKLDIEAANYYFKMHLGPKLSGRDVDVHANLLKSPESLESRMRWSDDKNAVNTLSLPPIQLTTQERDSYTKVMTEVNTYSSEMVLKFITGAEPLANFDKYAATVKSMGIDEIVKIYQAAYDRYMKKAVK